MESGAEGKPKPYKGIGMEGMIATWYANNTRKSMAEFRDLAKRIAVDLRSGDCALEIAPGPGYLAIELARLGSYRVAGLDVSRTFVRMARENAARAGVEVEFRHGDAAALPFADDRFEFIVCRAAFKNFSDPVGALCEMHRVLRPGGKALIIDMRNDASRKAIAAEVAKMRTGRINAFLARVVLSALRKRAHSRQDIERMVLASPFGRCDIVEQPLGLEIKLTKRFCPLAAQENARRQVVS
jgi:ubiquinone/menaquinone biosynthesis C-methylase UbiE